MSGTLGTAPPLESIVRRRSRVGRTRSKLTRQVRNPRKDQQQQQQQLLAPLLNPPRPPYCFPDQAGSRRPRAALAGAAYGRPRGNLRRGEGEGRGTTEDAAHYGRGFEAGRARPTPAFLSLAKPSEGGEGGFARALMRR
ncbi:hypothetical protein LX36DRAFT_661887 [Colletotrichum falcatum]|nr:hypothetical protein LX36DRAFT_661887 [Colletotrichum falcatum]